MDNLITLKVETNNQPQEIDAIISFLEKSGAFDFPALENGLFPAAIVEGETEYTGYANVWVRDNVYLAYCHYFIQKNEIASKTLSSLMAFFTKHKKRFIDVIESRSDPDNPMNRPHVRFNGAGLEEIDQKWPHAQNDALGYFLWLYSELAGKKIIEPKPENMSTLALFVFYLQKIKFWEDEDSGHWEEVRKISASSIGAATSGLKSLKRLLADSRLAAQCRYESKEVNSKLLDEMIEKGEQALKAILPSECAQEDSEKRRRYDGALIFLAYPLQIVDDETADQIVQDVTGNLQGEYGIRRYLGDSYWCPNYKKLLDPENRTVDFSDNMSSRDALLQKQGDEAQWCIFDPMVSAFFGIKYQKTRKKEYLEKQVEYLNRCLKQILVKDSIGPVLKCPELYYIEDNEYISNDNVPLLWTQANLRVALEILKQNLSLN